MAKIEIGRWSEQLRRMMGMAGVTDVSADLSPEISPVIVLEGPTPDLAYLKGERQVFCAATVSAVAAMNSKARLRNPPNSGVIAILKSLTMVSPTTTDLRVNINQFTTDLTLVDTTVPDPRWGALGLAIPASTLVASTTNSQASAPGGEPMLEVTTLANVPVVLAEPFPLLPGVAIDFGHPSVNIPLRFWVTWSERSFPVLEQ